MAGWSKKQLAVVAGLAIGLVAAGGYAYYLSGQVKAKTTGVTPEPSASASASASAAPSSLTPAATPTPTPAVGRCHTSDLSLSVAPANSAAGTAYQSVKLTNKSAGSCMLYGFPGVSLVDAGGNQLGAAAVRSGSAEATLTLAAGASAYAAVGFPNAGNFEPGTCSAVSTSLRVYPPDETAALSAADAKQACPGFSTSALSLTQP